MITEDYVSFETAKLLKEKGFGGECMSMYLTPKPHSGMGNPNEAKLAPHGRDSHYYDGYLYQCEAPTLQMAMKWLREVHKLFITIEIKGDPRKEDFIYYKWSVAKFCGVQIDRIDNGLNTPEDYWLAPGEGDEKPEYACEAAIKYCLENLI